MEILDRNSLESIGVQWGGAGAANNNTKGSSTVVAQGFTRSRLRLGAESPGIYERYKPGESQPVPGLLAAPCPQPPPSRPVATS